TPPCTPCMATRWGHARVTTRRTKERKAISRFLPLSPRPASTFGGSYATATWPDGKQIARHLTAVFAALPSCVGRLFARADSGFYCWEAVQAYEHAKACFILVARKTSRLLDHLQAAAWQPSPQTDADQECEFCYQPEGWGKAYRFIARPYKNDKPPQKREQYQLLDTPQYLYRVFVTNMDGKIAPLVWFYNQRAAAENLVKEANNDAGLAAHPSQRWATNCVHFQLVMLAYNLNCWLLLFN